MSITRSSIFPTCTLLMTTCNISMRDKDECYLSSGAAQIVSSAVLTKGFAGGERTRRLCNMHLSFHDMKVSLAGLHPIIER